MTWNDYSQILIYFGCHPEILALRLRETDPELGGEEFLSLCAYVESGFPVLASYPGHVVSIVGHTMDRTKTLKPSGDGVVDSSVFPKQFIVVDDNYFPYQLLGFRGDLDNYSRLNQQRNPPRQVYSIESVRVAVCPLPEKVFLQAAKAREAFADKLGSLLKNAAVAPMLKDGRDEPIVTRIFITSSPSFKRRKLAKATETGQLLDPFAVKIADLHLPHFIWVMEIAPLSHYLQGRCTAEIVLDATGSLKEQCLLYARTGAKLLLNGVALRATKAGADVATFAQYTHNLGEI